MVDSISAERECSQGFTRANRHIRICLDFPEYEENKPRYLKRPVEQTSAPPYDGILWSSERDRNYIN